MKLQTTLKTHDSPSTILIRIMVGGIFLAEGIQKFLHPEELPLVVSQKSGSRA
jgi:uncharacterized membrane protein YphA (DoxX/SURF4 family)